LINLENLSQDQVFLWLHLWYQIYSVLFLLAVFSIQVGVEYNNDNIDNIFMYFFIFLFIKLIIFLFIKLIIFLFIKLIIFLVKKNLEIID